MLRRMLILFSGGLLCLSVLAKSPADVLADHPDVSEFASWLETTGVTLAPQQTVFIPTNEAVDSLPAVIRDDLQKDKALLTRIVNYHIVANELPQAALQDGPLTTQEGDTLTVLHTDKGLTVDGVDITAPDAVTDEIIIHKIDGVLIPPIKLPEADPLEVNGDIVAAGSSTVYPLTQRIADVFSEEGYSDKIVVDSIGTSAGFERFCIAADTDISDASRAIKEAEIANCEANGRTPLEFRVGTDALAIVVSSNNTFLDSVTLEDLARIFGGAATWKDVRPEWPAEPIHLYSPGTDSGTFDYFVEAIFGKDSAPILAAQPTMSEDDEALVRGVEDDPYAIAYFGYAYYRNHADRLKLLAVNDIVPSEVTAENGAYPLARPLYIYSDESILKEKPQVAAFIQFYLDQVDNEILDVGYFPASDRAINLGRLTWLAAQS